ncbi:MAG: hypothetical protein ACOC1K_04625 [Nanoarchaeota archaeon]
MNLNKIEKLAYLTVVPVDIKTSIIEIKNFNIETFMGRSLENFKWPVFASLLFSVFAFAIASFFVIQYTKEFYAKGTIPSSWKLILWGFLTITVAEVGDLLVFYEWPGVGFLEMNFLLIIPHAIGGVLIGYGSYLLYKEIKL